MRSSSHFAPAALFSWVRRMCAVSPTAAIAAASATPDTVNTVFMRAKYCISSAGAMPYPMRSPASPCAFENVRNTTTFRPSCT